MAMPKLPPDVEKITNEGRAAADTIFDKKRTWVLVAVLCGISFALGGLIF